MKKYALTALTVAFCTAASTVGYGANLTDINNIPWAKSYINSVYESGIMVGDINSKGQSIFRGYDNMTYSEAAQLIYSIVVKSNFAGDINDTGINKYTMEMNGAGIASWANKAVAFCMEKGILTSYDLIKFKTNGSDNKITREDMAVFFGKALALSYAPSSGTSLSFSDTSGISAAAKPYIELLNKNGIVSGDNNNNFNPKASINRAEVAVMASKTFEVMKKGVVTNTESGYSQTTGVVASISESSGTWLLRILTANGTEGFVLDASTPVYLNATSNVGPSGIGLGDTVQVTHVNADISKIVITKDVVVDPNATNSQYGTTSIDKGELISAGDYKLGILDKSSRKVYYVVATDAEITLNGKKATMRQLSDLVSSKSTATATLTISSTSQEAIKVVVTETEKSSDSEGKITSINKKSITIKAGSKSYTYDLASSVSYYLNDKLCNQLDFTDKYDEIDDDNGYITAKLTFNSDDEVTKVKGETNDYDDEDKTYKGTISSFDGDSIKVSGSTKSYDLDSDVKIKIIIGSDDITDADDLEDILDDSSVSVYAEITVENGEVTEIEGYLSEFDGTISSMTVTSESKCLGKMWIQMEHADYQIDVEFDEDTSIVIDGTDYDDIDISSLKKYVNSNEDNINVTVELDDDGLATSIKD
ncbi:hypothetical protein SDC9_63725 [bioreactor metagenome]|uniref:SLH domain-containing protein n=1 Tax=bioreactor metagenome TaxID=1076179 RepID=A0A644XMW9_9ZZZZ|nr:S-layer homology domain-containing protein [Candidatus Metalachnospira sp.]